VEIKVHAENCLLEVEALASAAATSTINSSSLVISAIAESLPPPDAYRPEVWGQVLSTEALNAILRGRVAPKAVSTFREACRVADGQATLMAHATAAIRGVLAAESRTAGMLALLAEGARHNVLESLFYSGGNTRDALWAALGRVDDPFATIDPTGKLLEQVGLSPIGIAHLFRQYFFELDTFLGTPVGHVWLSPGSTVELIEVHTRRVLMERLVEQSIESIRKSESSLMQQDDLADAIKEENRSDTKLGVSASGSQSWVWGSANESASLSMENTQQQAREQTHKQMRQQSEKTSEEIKQSFKTTFRTVTETTDMATKRYVLSNSTVDLLNYELRRKMRHVAVQVQDIGSYLCWQTYVDDPGGQLGVANLVHIGAPPDVSSIPVPEIIVPLEALDENLTITFPPGEAILGADFQYYSRVQQGPVRCSQAGFRLASVTCQSVEGPLHGSFVTVDPGTIRKGDAPDSYTFTSDTYFANFGLLWAKGGKYGEYRTATTLHWVPAADQTKIAAENDKRLAMFTAKEKVAARQAFVEAARDRIKLASNIRPRTAEDLREEERVVVYRKLVQDMLTPDAISKGADSETHHLVAELLAAIFDIEKMLYFVAPEWWRARDRSREELGSIDSIPDPLSGKMIAINPIIPTADLVSWGHTVAKDTDYFITEDSSPARLGSSLGWLLQLDGDDLRNAFLNAPWVKAVLPIRPGKERAALNWLNHVERIEGVDLATEKYKASDGEPELAGKSILEVLRILADRVREKHEAGLNTQSFPDPLDDSSTVLATPIDRVFEHGFSPLIGGFKAHVDTDAPDFQIFDQWIEILPTDQVVAVEVKYDAKTGRQL